VRKQGIELTKIAYVHRGWGDEGSEARIKENVDFIVNAVAAVEAVCPDLQFWIFPTGGKVYLLSLSTSHRNEADSAKWHGFEFGKKVSRITPLKESAPRIPSPYGDHIFYYPQVDTLAKLSEGKSWKFADIRPDAIVCLLLLASLISFHSGINDLIGRLRPQPQPHEHRRAPRTLRLVVESLVTL
jgi:hypothetical protein